MIITAVIIPIIIVVSDVIASLNIIKNNIIFF